MSDALTDIAKKIKPVIEKYPSTYAVVFGSHALGDQREDSDVDIIIKVNFDKEDFSLLDLIGAEYEMEDILGKKVDLATDASTGKYICKPVSEDVKTIYEK